MATIANPLGGLFSTPSAPTPIITPDLGGTSGDGSDASGWLSGLGDLFAGIGTAVATNLKAVNAPTPSGPGSGWVYNPVTQQYHNAITGQALTSTGTLTSAGLGGSLLGGGSLTFLLLAFIGWLLFRHKLSE